MGKPPVIVLDACVLCPAAQRDLFMWLAARQPAQSAHKRKRPFKQILNEVVRSSLGGTAMAEPFTQPVFSLGRSRIDLTKALSLSADLEDQEILAKTKRA